MVKVCDVKAATRLTQKIIFYFYLYKEQINMIYSRKIL